ncbi:HAMP domain-containing sensor histidine kinase [Macrococcoides bohemicum]|uniref:HAMP domain-containing sensor histidine kinase n=1 Tax=Macrococcoides bohemicum TaxID=1903056 RepID=UPI00289719BB|nr:HAMP domain-containing sensor histidine kinase [Macrococcus bohemicus]
MNNMKLFPKLFIQSFSTLLLIVGLVHVLVFLIFPKTYLEDRKEEIHSKADTIAHSLNGKSLSYVKETLDFYSKNSEIKVALKGDEERNAVQIEQGLDIDSSSTHNSVIIEERNITLEKGQSRTVQFISTTDMQRDARDLSFKFLPLSLLVSWIGAMLVALLYAKVIKHNIEEIKHVTDNMMALDKTAMLKVTTNDEVGALKAQINALYATLLRTIDDLELKNREILELEQLKYDFFRGASHELKTPLASLKIILENMQYNIGRYKDRDMYIARCITITDELSHNISQILSLSSLEHLKHDEALIILNNAALDVLQKYKLIIQQKHLTINNSLTNEQMYIGTTALQIILSNIIGNAVKYTEEGGRINIGVKDGWFYIENTFQEKKLLDINKIFDVKFDLNKETSNGLGLYIVSNLLDNYNKYYTFEESAIGMIFKIKL